MNPKMKMKPLSLTDNMLIPENALKSKVVLSEKELKKVQQKFSEEPKVVGQTNSRAESEGGDKMGSFKKPKKTDTIIDQQSRCLSCWDKVDADRMYEISYRMIIDDHQTRWRTGNLLTIGPKPQVAA